MEITEFLLARITEDEETAQTAHTPGWEWSYDGGWDIGRPHYGICEAMEAGPEVLPHIARWAPTRVLAECEAKRRIVQMHDQSGLRWEGFPRADRQVAYCTHDHKASPCPTLLLLALPYADHPDCRPEWRL